MSPVRIRSPAPDFYPPIAMINRLVLCPFVFLWIALSALAQDYKLEPVSTAAPGLPAAYASAIQGQGFRVSGPSGAWCEVWLAKSLPLGAKPDEADRKSTRLNSSHR